MLKLTTKMILDAIPLRTFVTSTELYVLNLISTIPLLMAVVPTPMFEDLGLLGDLLNMS